MVAELWYNVPILKDRSLKMWSVLLHFNYVEFTLILIWGYLP